ncbi:MAG: hypothetical protein M1480_19180 [Bacteroidetes bacterium]|nr:hypothetical protein [Bacteroidota bacterium]
MRLLLSILFIMSFIPNNFAQLNWVQTNGPYGGNVDDIQIDKRGWLYLVVDAGFYKSTDEGNTWQKEDIGFNYFNVNSHVLPLSTGQVIYYGDGGMFISDTLGNNWKQVLYGPCQFLNKARNKLYYLLAGINVSADTGKTWNYLALQDSLIYDFTICNDTDFYCSTYNGLLKSNDEGKTWKQINHVNSISQIEEDKAGNLYMVWYGFLLISNDGEVTYKYINYPGNFIYDIFVSSDNKLYIGTEYGLLLSTDNGNTWTNIFKKYVNVTRCSKLSQSMFNMVQGSVVKKFI